MQSDRPATSAPVSPDDLETGRFLDLVRALDHQRTLASRVESLISACAHQLGRVPWEVDGRGNGERQRLIVRTGDLLNLAQSTALELWLAAEQLASDVTGG